MVRKHLIVSGRVQGVFFRDSCLRAATRHGVAGWVRNLPDGRVEAVFEGEPGAVDHMVEWAHSGPKDAHVRHVQVDDEPPEGLSGFRIRSTPWLG
ncbi:acylphosphatase [Streptoalloteichus tenebrarius]|nr:acylphosphatase [Streptoalloteichus tenebrarius]